jgi:hypothetical protein
MRRWTLIVLVLLFAGLCVAATLQFALGHHKHVQCPGPHAALGGPNDVVRCVTPSPSAP